MKHLSLLVVTSLIAFNAQATSFGGLFTKKRTVIVDAADSKVEWLGKKVVGDSHNGTIAIKEANLDVKGDALVGGSFVIDMTSITNTDVKAEKWNKKLVDHLESNDFFDVKNHPTATLTIKNVEIKDKKSPQNVKITGDLTIKGISKEVTFDAVNTRDKNNFTSAAKIVFNRLDYDIAYNSEGYFIDKNGNKKKAKDESYVQQIRKKFQDKIISNEVELDITIKADINKMKSKKSA